MILKYFDRLFFDPDRDAVSPLPPLPKKEIKKSEKVEEPENLVRDKAGGRARLFSKTNNGYKWDPYTGETTPRDRSITPRDKLLINERDLDETKYIEIKTLWATHILKGNGTVVQYMTGKDISKELQRRYKKGFGERTVYEYIRAINKAEDSSPIATDRGGVAKNMQNM